MKLAAAIAIASFLATANAYTAPHGSSKVNDAAHIAALNAQSSSWVAGNNENFGERTYDEGRAWVAGTQLGNHIVSRSTTKPPALSCGRVLAIFPLVLPYSTQRTELYTKRNRATTSTRLSRRSTTTRSTRPFRLTSTLARLSRGLSSPSETRSSAAP